MKKLLISFVVIAAAAFVALAGGLDAVTPITISASTNAAPIAADQFTNATDLTAWVDAIHVQVTSLDVPARTSVLEIVTVPATGRLSQNILVVSNLSASAVYYPRVIQDTTLGATISGEPARLALVSEKLVVRVFNTDATGTFSVVVTPILTDSD